MSTNSAIFNGSSRYASDFQSIITRSVGIASLPLTQLNNVKHTLDSRSSALSSIDTVFANLPSAVAALQTSLGTNSFSSLTSNAGVVSAAVSDGATTGSYRIEVTGMGSYSSTMSKDSLTKVSDPATQNIAAGGTFTLTVGGIAHEYTGFSTLSSLTAAINTDTDANVEATIVNLGSSSSPDYRLALQSKKLDNVSIQLTDSGSNVLTNTLAAGSKATYKVNGQSTEVSSDSRTVTLSPGLTVNLLGASATGVATTITVSRNTTAVQNALSGFATAYNAAVSELDKHRGSNGALAGDSIVSTLQQTLRDVAGYSTGTDGVSSLTSLGLTFDKTGRLSLDSSTFSSATGSDFSTLTQFLGTSTTSGFLKTATDALQMVSNSTNGILTMTIQNVAEQITRQGTAISTMEERIATLQVSLNEQMAGADALIASLEQQVQYISGLFSAMDTASNTWA